jgi:TonB family protein
MGAYGVVRIHVLIDETGKVIEAKVLCGHPIFTKPSLEAAYKARFSPTKLSGMPVKVNGVIVYNFTR